jgi:hypothetical protein
VQELSLEEGLTKMRCFWKAVMGLLGLMKTVLMHDLKTWIQSLMTMTTMTMMILTLNE